MDGETPREAAKREAAEQAVALFFGFAAVLGYVWVQRAADRPDAWRTLRMRWAKGCEKVQATIAAAAWKGAERSRLAYEAERPCGD